MTRKECSDNADAVKFPSQPPQSNMCWPRRGRFATLWLHLRDWATVSAGRVLNRLHIGGLVQPTTIHDSVTGQHIEIRVGTRFTVIAVDGCDYYFRRFSGKFYATGLGCCGSKGLCQQMPRGSSPRGHEPNRPQRA